MGRQQLVAALNGVGFWVVGIPLGAALAFGAFGPQHRAGVAGLWWGTSCPCAAPHHSPASCTECGDPHAPRTLALKAAESLRGLIPFAARATRPLVRVALANRIANGTVCCRRDGWRGSLRQGLSAGLAVTCVAGAAQLAFRTDWAAEARKAARRA
jgi:hypothetical protein